PPNPQQGIASVSPLSTLGEGDDRPKVSPASLNGSAPERSPVLANVPVASEEAAEELFDENWVSGWGHPRQT
ncbi:MAG: hypothetical protein ACO3NK_17325, partial [Prochlorotrichaceae cyanobacterium]